MAQEAGKARVERRLAAIAVAEVVGYSRLIGAALLALASTAQAQTKINFPLYLMCDSGTNMLTGERGDQNVVGSLVGVDANGQWTIGYKMTNGDVHMRNQQYNLGKVNDLTRLQWIGYLRRNPYQQMTGEIQVDTSKPNHLMYYERLYDNKGGQQKLLASTEANCVRITDFNSRTIMQNAFAPDPWDSTLGAVSPHALVPVDSQPVAGTSQPAAAPPKDKWGGDPIIKAAPPGGQDGPWDKYRKPPTNVAPAKDAPAPSYQTPPSSDWGVQDSVPIYPSANYMAAMVDVQLGSRTTRMTIDTGANIMSLPQSIADELVRNGDAQWGEKDHFTMADGSTKEEWTVNINRVTIGRHSVNNVKAGVLEEGSLLLPFTLLSHIGRFSIDTHQRKLTFN
jgi:hypothetical protein